MDRNQEDESAFDRLPRFDARDFEPPAWANGPQFQWGKKNGEGSSRHQPDPPDTEEDGDEEDEEWADASEGRSEIDPDLAKFTNGELKVSCEKVISVLTADEVLCTRHC